MTGNPYRFTGDRNMEQHGRSAELERAQKTLGKPNAEHLSIIGPPRTGKSAMLRVLARRLTGGRDGYGASVYLDLSHQTPESEEGFKRMLAAGVKAALLKDFADLAQCIDGEGAGLMDALEMVLDELDAKKVRLLVILDGMDHLFRMADVSRNLWDNLRELAQKRALRLATGSRARLRELCRSEESRTSDFWELFQNPMALGAFSVDQVMEAGKALTTRSVVLDSSAAKELRQWTGGHAALVAGFLGIVFDEMDSRTVRAEDIVGLADAAQKDMRDLLDELWDDLVVAEKMILVKLNSGELAAAQVPAEHRSRLEDRGMVALSGTTVRGTCRMMLTLAKAKGVTIDQIALLFSDKVSYLANIKPMLELRLRQIQGGDPELRGHVERALGDLHPEPTYALTWARNIATRALQLIWMKESADGKTIPAAWLSAWKMNLESVPLQNLVKQYGANPRIPTETGYQLHTLRFATGEKKVPKESVFVTKPIFILLEFVHATGDYGQHKTDPATQGVATACCHAAVELFAALSEH